jgi:hypothetical protein
MKRRSKASAENIKYYHTLKREFSENSHIWVKVHRGYENELIESLPSGHLQVILNRIEKLFKITEFQRYKFKGVDMKKLPQNLKPIEQIDIEAWESPLIRRMRASFNAVMSGIGRKKRL